MVKGTVDDQKPGSKRVKPTPVAISKFKITNLEDGEILHQVCVIIAGESPDLGYAEETNFVSVSSTDDVSLEKEKLQNWPVFKGNWKALVMLSPGQNRLTFNVHHVGGISDTLKMTVTYQPLLQLPPLHLAILVAKDSPLLMDCPPAKYGAISTAHSSIDAAISKLRMSAYMWQALTAEDMRQKGLGRRSFRLEEEWTTKTTIKQGHPSMVPNEGSRYMGCIAKVHIIRSEKTVADLRDFHVAQQNLAARNRDALHEYFETALKAHGPPFDSSCRPVVAGMILDSHYDIEHNLILGHAALGCHKPDGISLGVFGSHLVYSWPRFMEEIPACLMDLTAPGDTVGNDNNECDTMRGACFVGQGAFLHEVGHAFGAAHTTGIMARGYSKHWDRNFLGIAANSQAENHAKWDLQDVLKFKLLPHFRLPGDEPVTREFKNVDVIFDLDMHMDSSPDGEEPSGIEVLKVSCTVGLARVRFQHGDEEEKVHDFVGDSARVTQFCFNSIREQLSAEKPLKIIATGMNGRERTVDALSLFQQKPYIRIPNSNIMLRKKFAQSVNCDDRELLCWAMLLRERGQDGRLYRATSIDLRVGCIMDGAVVRYADGHVHNCGPQFREGTSNPFKFGGHMSEVHDIPADASITKVELKTRNTRWGNLSGIRMTLSNGESWGYLNAANNGSQDDDIVTLAPAEGDVIVGFYGQSESYNGFTHVFGILTAPKDIELPDQVYDMAEFKYNMAEVQTED